MVFLDLCVINILSRRIDTIGSWQQPVPYVLMTASRPRPTPSHKNMWRPTATMGPPTLRIPASAEKGMVVKETPFVRLTSLPGLLVFGGLAHSTAFDMAGDPFGPVPGPGLRCLSRHMFPQGIPLPYFRDVFGRHFGPLVSHLVSFHSRVVVTTGFSPCWICRRER